MRIRVYQFTRIDGRQLWACDIETGIMLPNDGVRLGVGETPSEAIADALTAVRKTHRNDLRYFSRGSEQRRGLAMMYRLLKNS